MNEDASKPRLLLLRVRSVLVRRSSETSQKLSKLHRSFSAKVTNNERRRMTSSSSRSCTSASSSRPALSTSSPLLSVRPSVVQTEKRPRLVRMGSVLPMSSAEQDSLEQLPNRPSELGGEQILENRAFSALSPESKSSSIERLSCNDEDFLDNGRRQLNEERRKQSKKAKYFAPRHDKNIFKKMLHPSYHDRNRHFKKIFVQKGRVEETDTFLASYSCALQRDILCQGRMYISQRSVCFYSNIFGFESVLTVPMTDVLAITKQKAAKIFPNSIQIERKSGGKHFFASFVNRDKSLNVLQTVFDRVNTGNPISPEELWEKMNIDSDKGSSSNAPPTPMVDSPITPTTPSDVRMNVDQKRPSDTSLEADDDEEVTCPCGDHEGRLVLDSVFPMNIKRLRDLIFTNSDFFAKFNEEAKTTGYASSEWTFDKDGVQSRSVTYTVAINQPMAKQVLANERQIINYLPKPLDGFIVTKECQNSGVPYAENFVVNCTYCITRVGRNQCRLKVHGGVVFKKHTFFVMRGFIEKSTYQGLEEHYHLLETMLRELRPSEDLTSPGDGDTASNGSAAIEDPSPMEQGTATVQTTPKTSRQTTSARSPASKVAQPDYRRQMTIIIVLLALLLFFNFAFVVYLTTTSHSRSLSFYSDMVKSLSETVNELASKVEVVQNNADPFPDGKLLRMSLELRRKKRYKLLYKNEVRCACLEHKGRLVFDTTFALPPKQFRELVFTDSEFFKKFNLKMNTTDFEASEWTVGKNDVETRITKFKVAIRQPVGPRKCRVEERQTLTYLPCPNDGFSVRRESRGFGFHSSDNFCVISTHCVTKIPPDHCRVRVHADIIYWKKTWSKVQEYIDEITYDGFEEFFTILEEMLREVPAEQEDDFEQEKSSLAKSKMVVEAVPDEPKSSTKKVSKEHVKTPSPNYRAQMRIIIALLVVGLGLNFGLLVHTWKNRNSGEESIAATIYSMKKTVEGVTDKIFNIHNQTEIFEIPKKNTNEMPLFKTPKQKIFNLQRQSKIHNSQNRVFFSDQTRIFNTLNQVFEIPNPTSISKNQEQANFFKTPKQTEFMCEL
ncbi:unnamed protein product [Caenorhabditis auriculariae]|uniref:VASt domain-containing protein n=1 Tax=Caenorhabditis auriculariae TaxID=2777116 RepID=A0A8S1GYK5_9PELO|nr:unnamed protein product [Caenorhabditis auriculariae]